MRSFPSIDQFRHAVEKVTHKTTYVGQSELDTPIYDSSKTLPTLTFTGTVKLHGTNAGVMLDLSTGHVSAQSRERILSVEDDNHGFCSWAYRFTSMHYLSNIFDISKSFVADQCDLSTIHIFGEWCGPSVNGKTAFGRLPERFVVFAVLVTFKDDSERWLPVADIAENFHKLFPANPVDINITTDFESWSLAIDFNHPETALDELERLTLEVEKECPAAYSLGESGMGEGIVWECNDQKLGRLVFKTKGDKHKGTRNKRIVQIAPEILESIDAFTAAVLTESRLQQGLDLIIARNGKATLDHMGEFLQWVGTDILKEESDTLKASGLERKTVMGAVNRRAKAWVATRFSVF